MALETDRGSDFILLVFSPYSRIFRLYDVGQRDGGRKPGRALGKLDDQLQDRRVLLSTVYAISEGRRSCVDFSNLIHHVYYQPEAKYYRSRTQLGKAGVRFIKP